MNLNLRVLENSNKMGFMFYIAYDGTKFDAFDELNSNNSSKVKNTIKGTFKFIIESLGFSWAKGIQQAGRTDAKVCANENILYVSSNYLGDLNHLKKEFNLISKFLKIKKIIKTIPNLNFPDNIESREYIYSYPLKKTINNLENIEKICLLKSGTYDVSEFTDKKGINLKEHIRTVNVSYKDSKLFFFGDSFMPKQVRIMSSFILNNSYDPLPGKYLTLNKVNLKKELENLCVSEAFLTEENLEEFSLITNMNLNTFKIEKMGDFLYIFYIPQNLKGEFIGKNGNNIRKIKKILGNIIVREINL